VLSAEHFHDDICEAADSILVEAGEIFETIDPDLASAALVRCTAYSIVDEIRKVGEDHQAALLEQVHQAIDKYVQEMLHENVVSFPGLRVVEENTKSDAERAKIDEVHMLAQRLVARSNLILKDVARWIERNPNASVGALESVLNLVEVCNCWNEITEDLKERLNAQ